MTGDTTELLPVVRAARLDDAPEQPQWLIDRLWARASVGILGGAPKCCKSWLALDLALSTASNTRCLDTFDVYDPGNVLLYMAEDAAAVVKTRLMGMCRHRAISLDTLALDVITAPSVRIDCEKDQARLARTVRRCSPRLLVLDPFVRLHRVDENDAGKVAAVLGYLRALQREYDVAILLVHHTRKNGPASGQAGQNLRGSGDLHAWGDSNLYLRRKDERLTLTIEHRAAAAPEPLSLLLRSNDDGTDPHLTMSDRPALPSLHEPARLDKAIVDTLRNAAQPLGRTALRGLLRVRNERLGEALAQLVRQGDIVHDGEGFRVPIPATSHAPERNAPC
jgi:hypothetical protein